MIKITIKSPLQERETDLLYGSFSNYIIHLLDKAQFKASVRLHPLLEGSQVVYFPIFLIEFVSSNWKQEYDNYVKETGDTKIIKDYAQYAKVIGDLIIMIGPKSLGGNNLGSMDDRGTLRLFIQEWACPSISHAEATPYIKKQLFRQDIEDLFGEHTASIMDNIVQHISTGTVARQLSYVISHELGHYLNLVRSGTHFRSKGQGDLKNPDRYARSTEEWQARLSQVFHDLQDITRHSFPDIDNDLKKIAAGEDPKPYKQKHAAQLRSLISSFQINNQLALNLISDIVHNDFQSFYHNFVQIMGHDNYFSQLTRKGMNRVRTRIHSAFVDFSKQKDTHDIYKVVRLLSRR